MLERASSVTRIDVCPLREEFREMVDALYLGIVFVCFASTWGLLCLLKRL